MATPSYFVVMIQYPRVQRDWYVRPACCEAIVDPELTYADVVERVRTREYDNIRFIHRIVDGLAEDCTESVFADAGMSMEAA